MTGRVGSFFINFPNVTINYYIKQITLGYPWATHKCSPRVAQCETKEYNRQTVAQD